MNCEQAQEAILLSEDTGAIAAGADSELAGHVARCAVCQALATRVARLEKSAAGLPAPGMEAGRQAAVRRWREPRWRTFVRPTWVRAAAALLVIGIGLAAIVGTRETPATVVEQLIDWNLAMADAQAPQDRERIYTSMAPAMESAVQRAPMAETERQLATRLLAAGDYLGRDADPVDRAEKFCDLADLLVDRLDTAAAANDARTVQRLGPKYGRLQNGLGAHLERLHATAYVGPNVKRLDRLAKRQADAEKRVDAMAERSPKASQKALKKMVENSKKQGRRPVY